MIQAFRDLHQLHRVFDAGSELLERSIGVPTCISGCGRCCQQNTPMCSTIEALNMVSVLNRTLKDAVDEAEGWLLEPHGLAVFHGVPRGMLPQDLMAEWKSVSKAQCPFLKANSECSVYSVRPLTCRAFGVFRDGIDLCPRPTGKGETPAKRAVINTQSDKTVPRLVHDYFGGCESRNASWTVRGFAPTLLLRAARPAKLAAYIADNKIASAKLIGVNIDVDLMWQPQLDALRQGVNPMVVLQQQMAEVA